MGNWRLSTAGGQTGQGELLPTNPWASGRHEPWASVSSPPEEGVTCALGDRCPQRMLPQEEARRGAETDQEEQERRGFFVRSNVWV